MNYWLWAYLVAYVLVTWLLYRWDPLKLRRK